MNADGYMAGTISGLVMHHCMNESGLFDYTRIVTILNGSIYSCMLMVDTDPTREKEYQELVNNKLKNVCSDLINIIDEYKRKKTDPSLN